jgi:lysophospholipase L1-like esterase
VEASSFGGLVYTDEHGFRVPKGGLPEDEGKSEAILILGDSVGFGPAVEEGDTFAGLLRKRFPARRIYNSSVIGYSTRDYRNVLDEFLPLHGEVTAVVLVYCLNDVSSASAQNIDRYLKNETEHVPEQNLTETLRSFTLLSEANDFLRSRSKLYLFIRHRLLGTQMRDWKAVLPLYSEDRASDVEGSARDIAEIAALLEKRGIPLVVVLSPFEYQLRNPEDPEAQVPQRRLGDLLTKAGVGTIDPRPAFIADGRRSTDYFLAYDPMHFSALGHRVIADVVTAAIAEVTPGARSPARS